MFTRFLVGSAGSGVTETFFLVKTTIYRTAPSYARTIYLKERQKENNTEQGNCSLLLISISFVNIK